MNLSGGNSFLIIPLFELLSAGEGADVFCSLPF